MAACSDFIPARARVERDESTAMEVSFRFARRLRRGVDDLSACVARTCNAIANQGNLPTAAAKLAQRRTGKERGAFAAYAHRRRRDDRAVFASFERDNALCLADGASE